MLLLFRKLFSTCVGSQSDRLWYGAFCASTVVHVTAITIFAYMWFLPEQQQQKSELLISSKIETTEEAVALEEPLKPILLIPKEESHSSGGQPLKLAALVKSKLTSPIKHFKTEPTSLLVNESMNEIPVTSFSTVVGAIPQTGEAKQAGNGQGKGMGNGKGDGKGTPFFGVRSVGKRFVYVVDCSRSMNHPHFSQAKTRFKRLQQELVLSISQLTPEKEFFVIFFSSDMYPMPARGMQVASYRNKKACFDWMVKLRADGQTDPRSALSLAMKLKPDVIYFLTDGSFDKIAEMKLKKVSQRFISIHTYSFGSSQGEKMMKLIARQNNGYYTFIP